jgi:hypothetical protein
METAEQEQRRAKEGKLQPEESKKHLIGMRLWFSNRKSFRKMGNQAARASRRSHFDQFHRFCRQCEEVICVSAFHPFGFRPFYSVSFSFPRFLFLFPFSFVSHSRVAPSFPACSNQSARNQ